MSVRLDWLRDAFEDLEQIVRLGSGGQKLVFRCEHNDFGFCVLKLIPPHAESRLDREIEAVERLIAIAADNIPRVYDFGTTELPLGRVIWLLEEYIDGVELSIRLDEGALGRSSLLKLALDLMSAAKEAESVNVVHRDIKPENIKIDSEGRGWLLDFGIARVLDLESLTRTDAVIGPHTPGYSAPEQFRYEKQQIDGRSDLFAIGIVLYESATGSNPFIDGAHDQIEVLHRVESMPLPRLKLDWDDEGRFADFVCSLTQKYPHQRPRSCEDASNWLQEIIVELGG